MVECVLVVSVPGLERSLRRSEVHTCWVNITAFHFGFIDQLLCLALSFQRAVRLRSAVLWQVFILRAELLVVVSTGDGGYIL